MSYVTDVMWYFRFCLVKGCENMRDWDTGQFDSVSVAVMYKSKGREHCQYNFRCKYLQKVNWKHVNI